MCRLSSGVPWFPPFYWWCIYFSSLRFFICELIMIYLFIVFGQVMILIYGVWRIDMIMPRKFAYRRGDYMYIYKNYKLYYQIFTYKWQKYQNITIWSIYGQPRIHLNIYMVWPVVEGFVGMCVCMNVCMCVCTYVCKCLIIYVKVM